MRGQLSREQIDSLHKNFTGRAVTLVSLGTDLSDNPIPLQTFAVKDVDGPDGDWQVLAGNGELRELAAKVEAGGSQDGKDA